MLKIILFLKNIILKYSFLRYLLSGTFITILNLLFLFILVQILSIWYLFASIISFCFGIITSYLVHKFFTFRDKNAKNIPIQFTLFLIFNLIMLGLNTILMYFWVDFLNLYYLLAQIITTLLIAFMNYLVFKRFLFKNS